MMGQVINDLALLFWLLVAGLLVSTASNARAQTTKYSAGRKNDINSTGRHRNL